MPNEGRGAKSDFITGLLQSPADIHVIPGGVKDWIETPDLGQSPFIECHVTTGDVFRLTVGEHHMGRAAGRNHNRRSHERIFRWQEVRPANTREFAFQQVTYEVI